MSVTDPAPCLIVRMRTCWGVEGYLIVVSVTPGLSLYEARTGAASCALTEIVPTVPTTIDTPTAVRLVTSAMRRRAFPCNCFTSGLRAGRRGILADRWKEGR